MEYLGLKLALRRKDFAPLVQQARSKTLTWGIRHLSLAGRVTLRNSVLLPSSVYSVTHSFVPRSILNDIEKLCRIFLWDIDENHKSIHYASWKSLSKPRRMGGLGFHANSKWVGPLRSRITWEYISKPTSFFHRCMKQKYGNWPWVADFKRGDSTVWKILCDGANSLACCVRWKVCNGRDINILNHTWIWDRSIALWPTYCDIAALEDRTVSDLISPAGDWDKQKLLICFGEDRILEMKIWSELHEDVLELMKIPIGSTISAMVYNSSFLGEDDPCCAILKAGLRPRVRMFWWRVYKNIVPTNSWLLARGFDVDVKCPMGCNMCEDLNHITTDCKQLMEILDILDSWGLYTPRFADFSALQVALEENVKSKDIGMKLYCLTVYHCWLNRNAVKHGKEVSTQVFMAASILESLNQDGLLFHLEQRDTVQSFGLCLHSSWCPPPTRWLKINVDGALLRSNAGGIGIVIRDSYGKLIVAAGWSICHWDSTQVEMMAIQGVGKLIAEWMYELNGVIVEGDSASVIEHMQNFQFKELWKLQLEDWDKWNWLQMFQKVVFVHTNRRFNMAAHFCAQRAIDRSFLWDRGDSNNGIPQ